MDPRTRFGGRQITASAAISWAMAAGLGLSVAFPAVAPARWLLLAGAAVATWLVAEQIRRRSARSARRGAPTLVVGDADDVVRAVEQLAHHPEAGARPVATAGILGGAPPTKLPHEDGADLLGAIARRRIRHVVIASATWVDAASELFGPDRPAGVRVSIAPRSGVARRETAVVDLCGVPYLTVEPRTGVTEAARCRARTSPAPVGVDATRYIDLVEGDLTPAGEPVDVSIVVVTHESAADITACLESVDRLRDAARREVIVVDNASTDGTAELVAAHPGARLVRKRRRDGFSVNVNTGVAASRGRYVLLLNPDTSVEDGVVDALVEHLERHPGVGAVAPRLRYPDGRPQPNARRFPSPLTALVRRTPRRRLLRDRADAHLVDTEFAGVRDVDWCLGAALMVRASALHQLGGLDDGYRLYCEDIDLCWRLREAGWAVQQLAEPVVAHALGELTSKRFLTRRTVWHLRSVARFARLHGLRPVRSAPPSPVVSEAVVDLVEPVEAVIDLRPLAEVER